ncbi:hypothetical protein KR059_007075, partial [Drosophila kikkawai]
INELINYIFKFSASGELSVNVITIINTNASYNNNNSSSNNNNNNNSNSISNNNHHNGNTEPETEVEASGDPQQLQVQQLQQLQPVPNFVTIPLLERRRRSHSRSHCRVVQSAPIICLQNGSYPEDLAHLSRSKSCFLRVRRTIAKLFAKIMGSNNPSEADRYDYYDCE